MASVMWDYGAITAITAGRGYTVGLRKDGTVVAVGLNDNGQCDLGDWKNVASIHASGNITYASVNRLITGREPSINDTQIKGRNRPFDYESVNG